VRIENKKVLIAAFLIVSTIIASFAALSVLDFTAQAQTPVNCTIRIAPSVSDAQVCTIFVVDVNIVDFYEFPVYDYEFLLIYNSAEMTATGAYDGDFLVEPVIFNSDLTIAGQAFCQGWTTAGGATGSGTLASVEFHCTDTGPGHLNLEVIYISDQFDNMYIPNNVIPASVPQWEPPPAIVSLDPATHTVPVCVPFTVNVMIEDVYDLHGFDISLSYDTAYVDCTNIVDACFLPSPKHDTHKVIDDVTGTINFGAQSDAITGGNSGSGAIATITFHCTGPGESILNIDAITAWDSAGMNIPCFIVPQSRVIQRAYWEPVKLQHIVEWPGTFRYWDIPFPWPPATPAGYPEVMAELEAKGFTFDPITYPETATATAIEGEIDEEVFSGIVTSLWSTDTLEDGTRACMLSAEMDDGTNMTMAFVTNLLPPEQVPEVDPYIIVNAQPYIFVDFYWWCWPRPDLPLGGVIRWPYWWYDSHSHPNWFWGPYWWWRCYTKAYYLGMPYPPVDINWAYWRPWWGWWWHWAYWRHWYWWSSYFPYDP